MGFLRELQRLERAAAREQRNRHLAIEREQREQERAERREAAQRKREHDAAEREAKQRHVANRSSLVDRRNAELTQRFSALDNLLIHGLDRMPGLDWQRLAGRADPEQLDADPELRLGERPQYPDYRPAPPTVWMKMLPGWRSRHQMRVERARERFEDDRKAFTEVLTKREARWLEIVEAANQRHQQTLHFWQAYRMLDRQAVAEYFKLAAEVADWPKGFPKRIQTAFQPESRQLLLDFDLPTLDDSVPDVEQYRYVKSSDQIAETKKPQRTRQGIYTLAVAQSLLRRLDEIFRGDHERVVDVAVVNAFVSTIDPATGKQVHPCLMSVRATRQEFESINLRLVDPLACLRRLNAVVSQAPSEMVAVKPLADLSMSDPRFIQEADVLGGLDDRPNLMELTPGEFENLITNLFQRMGLDTKLTQASRDGGVDCVAFNHDPVLGGKVVIQAKRYKNTVGVSAVRDLYGTMMNEGASKGILVTTSGYGPAAHEFANGKPIELFSGSNLLYLLKEHAGIEARIVMPEAWIEPAHG